MRVVITPAYSVSDKLIEVINREGDVIVVITDDVSPIFPIDRREIWIERCSLKRGLIITSISKNDEDVNWLDDVYKQLQVEQEEPLELILFHTDDNSADLSLFAESYKFDLNDHSPIFQTRFGEEFAKYTTPKQEQKELGEEPVNIIPVISINNNPRFGLITKYPSELNSVLTIYVPRFSTVAEHTALLSYWVKAIFGTEGVIGHKVGAIDGVSTVFIEVNNPEWLSGDGVNSNRNYISLDADAVFVDEETFKEINSVTHLAHAKLVDRMKVLNNA